MRNLFYLILGYEVEAARYLAKPLERPRLREALLFCAKKLQEKREILLPTRRGHRSYFVNLDYASYLRSREPELSTGEVLPVRKCPPGRTAKADGKLFQRPVKGQQNAHLIAAVPMFRVQEVPVPLHYLPGDAAAKAVAWGAFLGNFSKK